MLHNRTFKVLSNLILLVFFCAGQVSASPNNNAKPVPEVVTQQALMIPSETIRISLDSNGVQGNSISERPSISANGRYIAFASQANNLVSGDTNTSADVFVHDQQSGQTTRISVTSDGTQGNGDSTGPSISSDGRYVAFRSSANNLVSGDTNLGEDIFIHDRQNGQTKLVSVASDGEQGDGESYDPSISADGRYVAFYSFVSTLVSEDTNNLSDVFVHDQQSGQTTRVSVASNGMQGNGFSRAPSISADGRYVAFMSSSSNLVSGDTNNYEEIFVHDRQSGQTTLVSVASDGTRGDDDSYYPSISADGRYVAFYSFALNLVSGGAWNVGVYVHDRQSGQTTLVSDVSDGTNGNGVSALPTISADGRYVAFMSSSSNLVSGDTNGVEDVFVRDTQTNTTTRVSLDSNGAQGDGPSGYRPSISADGHYVAFSSLASNLVSGDTNEWEDVFVHENSIVPGIQKPPVILVHGFQGLSTTGGYNCSNDGIGINDIERYQRYGSADSNSTLKAENDGIALADWLAVDNDVWIAHLESTPLGTPSLEFNAQCLRDQIDYVYSQNPQPITVIAHSMGGVVSRAAIRYLDNQKEVKGLYTLGSPHAGLPTEIISILPLACSIQSGACDMSVNHMRSNFNPSNPNVNGVVYNFIGGNGGTGFLDWFLKLTAQGPNDGLVGQYSAVGWINPDQIFAPPNWPSNSIPGHFFTNETHPAKSDPSKAYYVAPTDQTSDSFKCINGLMKEPPDAQYCQSTAPQALQVDALSSNQSTFTEIKSGHLNAGQAVTLPFAIDNVGATLFYLSWSDGNTPSFTLTRPDAQVIDPIYAAAHPSEVTYEISSGGPETAPASTYSFASGQVGNWQATITATDAIDYKIFGLIDSTLQLTANTDAEVYQVGDTATITANLANGSTGLTGATVTAKLTRPDTVLNTIPLTDHGNGVYSNTYTVPDAPGHLTVDVTATGSENGTAYSRQKSLLVAIAPNDLQLTGTYNDQPRDDNADSIYEYLDFMAEVNLTSPGEYAVSGELYAGDQPITQSGDFFQLAAGTQTVTLSFDGGAIREAGLNGPYIVKNLYFTPIDTGITAANVENAWTTPAYSYTQFGMHACYILTWTLSI